MRDAALPPCLSLACRGGEDEALLAYQIAFDLVDAELQAFMLKVSWWVGR